MRPLTEQIPKVLLPVGGRPFADHQLEWLAAGGVDEVVLCVGHLGDHVRAYVGTGDRWGLSASYSSEGEQLRGTAGALRLAYDRGCLAEQFLVTYGDSYLDVPIAEVWATFHGSGAPALMTVYRNAGQGGASNASYRDGWVVRYDKTRRVVGAELDFIDYGLLALDRGVITDYVPVGATADLSEVLTPLASAGRLAGFEATRRFYEIGSPEGLHDLEQLLAEG